MQLRKTPSMSKTHYAARQASERATAMVSEPAAAPSPEEPTQLRRTPSNPDKKA